MEQGVHGFSAFTRSLHRDGNDNDASAVQEELNAPDEDNVSIVFNNKVGDPNHMYNSVNTNRHTNPSKAGMVRANVLNPMHDLGSGHGLEEASSSSKIPAAYRTLPNEAWSPDIYFSVRGSENVLIYIWIAKDLSWTQNWYYSAFVFGGLALFASFLMICRSVTRKNPEDTWHGIAQFMWLFANFWWMSNDIYNDKYPYSEDAYQVRKNQSMHVMESALIWLAVWYLIIRPANLFPVQETDSSVYDDADLRPRFSYFKTWRQYENIHVLFWLGKDYGWAALSPVLWIGFSIPTVLIAIDFCYITGKTKVILQYFRFVLILNISF